MREQKAQLSIEYLILAAVVISALAVVLPTSQKIYASAVFATDVKSAEFFLNEIKAACSTLEILGNGSEQTLETKILTEWNINLNSGKFNLEINSSEAEKTKTVYTNLNTQSTLSTQNLTDSLKLTIKKQNGKILIIKS